MGFWPIKCMISIPPSGPRASQGQMKKRAATGGLCLLSSLFYYSHLQGRTSFSLCLYTPLSPQSPLLSHSLSVLLLPFPSCPPNPSPSEVAEPWAPTQFPLVSGAFTGDQEEEREAGRGRSLGIWDQQGFSVTGMETGHLGGSYSAGWRGRGGREDVHSLHGSMYGEDSQVPGRLGYWNIGGTHWTVCLV